MNNKGGIFYIGTWLLAIVLIPVLFWSMRDPNAKGGFLGNKVQRILQSEFEIALREGRVSKVVIDSLDNRPSDTIRGEMKSDKEAQLNAKDIAFITTVVYSEGLDEMIRKNCLNVTVKKKNTWLWNSFFQIGIMLVVLIVIYLLIMKQMKRGGGALDFGKNKARLSMPGQNKVTFNDVCGIEEAKQEVEEIVDYLKFPAKYQKVGAKIPKGVLLVGSPGTGKTLLARAIAGEAGVPFFSISGSDFLEMFVGVGASRVRDMFEDARRNSPCLIFIDEIDAIGRARASVSSMSGGHDEREQTLNALLVQMDGFEQDHGFIVLAATNRPEILDEALLRPGRFDRRVTIDLPDVKGRYEILKLHASKVVLAKDVDLYAVARATVGFSGAELANLVNEAALLAASADKEEVVQKDFEEARDKVRWGKERRSLKLDEKEKRLTAYHEAGHAIINLHCKNLSPLHKVTIVPRGQAMGLTMSVPEADSYGHSRNELLDNMAFAFGGRVAEELIFKDVTTGAAQDIQQATQIAKHMVCDWGMSNKMGLVKYISHSQTMYTNSSGMQEYSELTGREIDEEIHLLIEQAHQVATQILSEHREQLEKLAQALLEEETMSAIQIYELLEMTELLEKAKKQEQEAIQRQKQEMEEAEKKKEVKIEDLLANINEEELNEKINQKK